MQTTVPTITIDIAKKMHPDLIITDWFMLQMNGLEFIKKIKSNPETKDILIMVATGVMTAANDMKVAMEAGATDFIRKPIDEIELLARTNSMMQIKTAFLLAIEKERLIAEKETTAKRRKIGVE